MTAGCFSSFGMADKEKSLWDIIKESDITRLDGLVEMPGF